MAVRKNLNVAAPPRLTAAVTAGTAVTIVGWQLQATDGSVKADFIPQGNGTRRAFVAATTDVITCPSHGYLNGDTVYVRSLDVLPTGLAKGIAYVRDVSGDTFKLAATVGGAAIDLTGIGGGVICKITPVVLNEGNKMEIADEAFGVSLYEFNDTFAAAQLDAMLLATDKFVAMTDAVTTTNRLPAFTADDWAAATAI
jgi:hypothetical protein